MNYLPDKQQPEDLNHNLLKIILLTKSYVYRLSEVDIKQPTQTKEYGQNMNKLQHCKLHKKLYMQ